MISRADPAVEREAIAWLVNDILQGEHDPEEVRLAEEVKRLSMPELPEEADDAAAR